MGALQTPRTRLTVAIVILAALIAAASAQGVSAAVTARVILGVTLLVGLAWWTARTRQRAIGSAQTVRLQIQQRVGLSPRCGLALVQVDGAELLVAYGDGFAQFHAVHAPAHLARGRRPVRKTRALRRVVSPGGRS